MASFLSKLARLPPLAGAAPAAPPAPMDPAAPERIVDLDPRPAPRPRPGPVAPAAPERPPTLDELRDRIARIVARDPAPTPRADPARGELPFVVSETPLGPLYFHRSREAPTARVGRISLFPARDADPAMLALLALDPRLASCDPRGALYVDTETTGLAGGTGTVPFLIGLCWFDVEANCFVREQLLLRRLGEEAPMLALLGERIAAASMLVSYNGKAFDLPLLRTRYVMNRMPAPAEPPHLDLVHVARRLHSARLASRTLVAIENEVLGRGRVGDVAGGDIVATYMHFLRSGDEEALLGVVEHNAADVLAMVALVGLYGEPLGEREGDQPGHVPAGLDPADLAAAARVLRRAGALDRAALFADHAVARGGGAAAVRARGDIAKARGDKARALADYEQLAAEIDDDGIRLELCKLYEHHVRSFEKALHLVHRGTGEEGEALDRRKGRLQRKLDRTEKPRGRSRKKAATLPLPLREPEGGPERA